MELNAFKWVALTSLFVAAMLGGLSPLKFKRSRSASRYLSLGNMFSGGIFLGGGLMHLLPEAHETIEEVMATISSDAYPDALREFPTAFWLSGIGFFAVLIVEEAALAWTANKQRKLRDKKRRDEAAAAAIAGSGKAGATLAAPLLAGAESSGHGHSHGNGEHAHAHSHGGHSHSHGGGSSNIEVSTSVAPEVTREDRANRKLASSLIHGLAPRSNLVMDESTPPASPEPSRVGRAPRTGPRLGDGGGNDSDVDDDEVVDRLTGPTTGGDDSDSESAPAAGPLSHVAADKKTDSTTAAVEKATKKFPPPNIVTKSAPEPATAATSIAVGAAPKSDAPSDEHDAGGGHGHSHGGGDDHDHFALDPAVASSIVAYILVLALSFHSVFEGIAFGTQDDIGSAIALYLAIMAHTPLAGFALGVSLVNAKVAFSMYMSCIVLFSLTVPSGTMLGLLFSELLEGNALKLVSACFQAFSSGTFLFVALGEIIPKELASPRDKGWKVALCVLGFFGMSAIKLWDR